VVFHEKEKKVKRRLLMPVKKIKGMPIGRKGDKYLVIRGSKAGQFHVNKIKKPVKYRAWGFHKRLTKSEKKLLRMLKKK